MTSQIVISGVRHPVISEIICGWYDRCQEGLCGSAPRGRESFVKIADHSKFGVPVYLYYWSVGDPADHGWWMGHKIGGDQVWAFNNRNTLNPPEYGWKCPHDGPVDTHMRVQLVIEKQDKRARIENHEPKHANTDQATPSTAQPSACELGVKWQYEHAPGHWHDFTFADSEAVEAQWKRFRMSPQDDEGIVLLHSQKYERLIDLETMLQVNLHTNRKRAIRRCAPPPSSSSSASFLSTGVPASADPSPQQLLTEVENWAREADKLRKQLEIIKKIASKVPMLEATVEHLQKEAELWRHQTMTTYVMHPRPHLMKAAQDVLRCLVPDGHVYPCTRMHHVDIVELLQVVSPLHWKQYCMKKNIIKEAIASHRACPWVSEDDQNLDTLQKAFAHIELEPSANEVLLLHGTKEANLTKILQQGLDPSVASRALYGEGVYFSSNSCKANQYCDEKHERCILVCRVVLGHPFSATSQMKNRKRPPEVSGLPGVLHDCIRARPGINNGQKEKQVHWEYVVFEKHQIYPEYVLRFTMGQS